MTGLGIAVIQKAHCKFHILTVGSDVTGTGLRHHGGLNAELGGLALLQHRELCGNQLYIRVLALHRVSKLGNGGRPRRIGTGVGIGHSCILIGNLCNILIQKALFIPVRKQSEHILHAGVQKSVAHLTVII